MAKEDLNKSQSVADGGLNTADSADQQGLNNDGSADQQNQDGTLADGTSTDKTVKYEDLKKATDRATAAEEQAAHSQRELELLQANVQGQQQQQQQTQQQTAGTNYEQAMINCGLTAEDMYEGANIVKVNIEKERLDGIVTQQNQAFSVNQQFVASHSDFSSVVGSVNPSTMQVMTLTPEALALVQRKPYLQNASYQAVYDEVLQDRKLKELEKKAGVNQEHLNRQNTDNDTLPMGGSAAGGGGGAEQNQTQTLMTRDQTEQIEVDIANGKYDQ